MTQRQVQFFIFLSGQVWMLVKYCGNTRLNFTTPMIWGGAFLLLFLVFGIFDRQSPPES